MTKRKPAKVDEPTIIVANDQDDLKGALKSIGGSQSDRWNNTLATQVVDALWTKNSNAETRDKQLSGTVAALIGIRPKDELEGMMAAQLIAAHNAAMECYRRAIIGEQTFEGRKENSQPGQQTLTYMDNPPRSPQPPSWQGAAKGDGRTRPRPCRRAGGGGQCRSVRRRKTGGMGLARNQRNDPMQSKLPMHLSPRCEASSRPTGKPCRNGAMKNGRCRMHGGKSTGAPKGNRNAWKHGLYSAKAADWRSNLRGLISR